MNEIIFLITHSSLTGFLLMIIWLKIYQKYFLIKSIKRLRKIQLLQQFYNNQTYLAFNKNFETKTIEPELMEPTYENYQKLPRDLSLEDQVIRIKAENSAAEDRSHVYVNEALEPELSTVYSRIVKVDTMLKEKPNYFFGDTFGVLPCRKCNRSLETIEASISFGEEPDEMRAEMGMGFLRYLHPLITKRKFN